MWIALAAILIAGCGQSTPAAEPLDAKVTDTTSFKEKYRSMFDTQCGDPTCYFEFYKSVVNRLPQDASVLSASDELNMRTRIESFMGDLDDLQRKGCDKSGQGFKTDCQLLLSGPKASIDYFRNYVKS